MPSDETQDAPGGSGGASDQRRATRREVELPVRLVLAEQTLEGETRDASRTGVMFTTGDLLRVEVEVEEDGRLVRRTGRLMRVQRMSADRIAVAVELDG